MPRSKRVVYPPDDASQDIPAMPNRNDLGNAIDTINRLVYRQNISGMDTEVLKRLNRLLRTLYTCKGCSDVVTVMIDAPADSAGKHLLDFATQQVPPIDHASANPQ